jgi:hypothetical protein
MDRRIFLGTAALPALAALDLTETTPAPTSALRPPPTVKVERGPRFVEEYESKGWIAPSA